MKKKVWNHLLYDIITKTINKTSIPIFPDITTIIKKIDPITNISEKGSVRSNNIDIGNISSDYIGIFNDIVGYEDIKRLFIMAINANEPIHIMIIGPSVSAKTIFMKCHDVYWFIGIYSHDKELFDILIPYYIIENFYIIRRNVANIIIICTNPSVFRDFSNRIYFFYDCCFIRENRYTCFFYCFGDYIV